MAEAISTTRARASNPDLCASLELFDDVVDRLSAAVAFEEDPHDPRHTNMTSDTIGAAVDATMTDAVAALGRAVVQAWAHHPAARTLFSALHTLNLALLSEESRDRVTALGLASRHPALTPLDAEGAECGLVVVRLHRLRGLLERLEALTASDLHDAPTLADVPGF
ncbi:hypothetical protein [Rhodobaculum claviforme]|uniref:Uncharacterized protein n=1 Tax=Rhodobaculum claviforme TaxID=1549854 RepID=A0A934TJJ9_9RHOB|nr:hypothetical protein [Rhodobaculum claviforme]MBK5927335.1 hypothetical protein [Rhodobaculum claviforme]